MTAAEVPQGFPTLPPGAPAPLLPRRQNNPIAFWNKNVNLKKIILFKAEDHLPPASAKQKGGGEEGGHGAGMQHVSKVAFVSLTCPRTLPSTWPDSGDSPASRARQHPCRTRPNPLGPSKHSKAFTQSPLLTGSKIPRECYPLNQECASPPCLPQLSTSTEAEQAAQGFSGKQEKQDPALLGFPPEISPIPRCSR